MPSGFQELYAPVVTSLLERLRRMAPSVAAAYQSFAMTRQHLKNCWALRSNLLKANGMTIERQRVQLKGFNLAGFSASGE
jgi:hypothetical protein